ncbi:MAG: type II secretion system protein GspM [Leptospirales bacterium]
MIDLRNRLPDSWTRSFNTLKDRWETLSLRERRLIGTLGAILSLYLFWAGIETVLLDPYHQFLSEEQSLKSDILTAQSLVQEIRQSQEEIQKRSLRLTRDRSGFSLISYLEQEADQTHIRSSITQMTPRSLPPEENYHSTLVSIRIEKVDLPHILVFLARLQRSPHLIRISHLTIERRFDQHRLLDVRLDVQSIQAS